MEKAADKPGRGGARKGAGRKPSPSHKVDIRIQPRDYVPVEAAARTCRMKVSAFIRKCAVCVSKLQPEQIYELLGLNEDKEEK